MALPPCICETNGNSGFTMTFQYQEEFLKKPTIHHPPFSFPQGKVGNKVMREVGAADTSGLENSPWLSYNTSEDYIVCIICKSAEDQGSL